MPQYLFSAYSTPGNARKPMSEEEMRDSWRRILELEQEMKSKGALVFSGRLTEPDTATVVSISKGDVLTTDGPFVEAKEHLGGFYIIEAKDLDVALTWAAKVVRCIDHPVEVRPFWHEATP